MRTVRITGIDANPMSRVFTNDVGTWNVEKALRDCAASKHKLYMLDVGPAIEANRSVETDPGRIEMFKSSPHLTLPLLVVMTSDKRGWLIDGHHRLRAMHALGIPTFAAYIIEAKDEPTYRILFNGKPVLKRR